MTQNKTEYQLPVFSGNYHLSKSDLGKAWNPGTLGGLSSNLYKPTDVKKLVYNKIKQSNIKVDTMTINALSDKDHLKNCETIIPCACLDGKIPEKLFKLIFPKDFEYIIVVADSVQYTYHEEYIPKKEDLISTIPDTREKLMSNYGNYTLNKIIYGGRTRVIFKIYSNNNKEFIELKQALERSINQDKILNILKDASEATHTDDDENKSDDNKIFKIKCEIIENDNYGNDNYSYDFKDGIKKLASRKKISVDKSVPVEIVLKHLDTKHFRSSFSLITSFQYSLKNKELNELIIKLNYLKYILDNETLYLNNFDNVDDNIINDIKTNIKRIESYFEEINEFNKKSPKDIIKDGDFVPLLSGNLVDLHRKVFCLTGNGEYTHSNKAWFRGYTFKNRPIFKGRIYYDGPIIDGVELYGVIQLNSNRCPVNTKARIIEKRQTKCTGEFNSKGEFYYNGELYNYSIDKYIRNVNVEGKPKNIILVGCVGTGKTTLLNKLTRANEATSGGGTSLTRKVDTYPVSYGNFNWHITDTPGLKSSEDRINHATAIKFALERKPVDLILVTVNGKNRRADNIAHVAPVQRMFKGYENHICLVVTHWDMLEKPDKNEYIQDMKKKLPNITRIVFSGHNIKPKDLCNSIKNHITNPVNIKFSKEDLLVALNLMNDTNKDLKDVVDKIIQDFEKVANLFTDFINTIRNNDDADIILDGVRVEIGRSMEQCIDDFNHKYGVAMVDMQNYAALYLLRRVLSEKVQEVREYAETYMSFDVHDKNDIMNMYKKCRYCGQVWVKVERCPDTVCGEVPKDKLFDIQQKPSFFSFKFFIDWKNFSKVELKNKVQKNSKTVSTNREKTSVTTFVKEGFGGCGKRIHWDKDMLRLSREELKQLKSLGIGDVIKHDEETREEMEKIYEEEAKAPEYKDHTQINKYENTKSTLNTQTSYDSEEENENTEKEPQYKSLLKKWNLEKYISNFEKEDLTDVKDWVDIDIEDIDDEDLMKLIPSKMHRKRFVRRYQEFQKQKN